MKIKSYVDIPKLYDGLPDSKHLNAFCTVCGCKSAFRVVSTHPLLYNKHKMLGHCDDEESIVEFRASILECTPRKHSIVVVEERCTDRLEKMRDLGRVHSEEDPIYYRGIEWWPHPLSMAPNKTPKMVSKVYEEAHCSSMSNCFRGSLFLARTVIEAVMNDKNMGQPSDLLWQRIKVAHVNGIIDEHLFNMATLIRESGNLGHFDPLREVLKDDVHNLLFFVRRFLYHVYERPDEISMLKLVKENLNKEKDDAE